MTINAGMMSSLTDEWATPPALFAKLDAIWHFTLDVCATKDNAKCARYYGREQDGLKQDWLTEVCWMNPPYGAAIRFWCRKAYDSSLAGATVVALLPSRTDAGWFHRWVLGKAELTFIKGRLQFSTPTRRKLASAPFPSVIAAYRPQRGI